jgi:tetratricopeptide (TPR) repeat protein
MELNKNQKALLDWLLEFCKNPGSGNTCIVEGFSGLGKRDIAYQLQIKSIAAGARTIFLPLAEGSRSMDDFFLDLAAELSNKEIYGLEEAISNNKPLTLALRRILENEQVWIIFVDFQHIADGEGKLLPELERLMANISSHPTKGRLMAFSNQIIQRGRWSDQITFKELKGLQPNEAKAMLEQLMVEKNIREQLDEEKKSDILRILGNNPRAINIFTERWRWASNIDELIGEIPAIWEARDHEISHKLLNELEEQLLQKSLERFNAAEVAVLEGLSALRKPFLKQAIERIIVNTQEAAQMLEKFQQYFFLDNKLGWFSFHPILKEICKAKLGSSKTAFKKAHAKAAEYYTRHFTQANLKNESRLGGYFVEARYHLIMAQAEDKLQEVSANFGYFIRATIKSVSPVPTDPQLLDERIGLLTAFLGSGGPKGLEYHLARCLEKRGLAGDAEQALLHIDKAIGLETPTEAWLLKMRLEEKLHGVLKAIDTGYIAISRTPVTQNVVSVYLYCAELLEKAKQADRAIDLLKEGIVNVPIENDVVSLYVACAELMDRSGNADAAIALLKDGIVNIPAVNNASSLYVACATVMDRAGKTDEAIGLLREGIDKIPAGKNSFALYQICAELMDRSGNADAAIALLKDGLVKVPTSLNGYKLFEKAARVAYRDLKKSILKELHAIAMDKRHQQLAQLLHEYADGNFAKAKELLDKEDVTLGYPVTMYSQVIFGLLASYNYKEADSIVAKVNLQPQYNIGGTWLLTLNALKNNKMELARTYYRLLVPHHGLADAVTIDRLVQYWFDTKGETSSPYDFFPHLPTGLTGYPIGLSANSPSIEADVKQALERKGPDIQPPPRQDGNLFGTMT